MLKVKSDFPIFDNYPKLVYLDSSSTSQKPKQVINAVKEFYEKKTANIHRGIYTLSQQATEAFEDSRKKVAEFIGGGDPSEIIFSSNTSEAINLVSYSWGRKFLKKGDIVVISEMEHHSNIVPWLRLKEELGINIYYLPIDKNYRLDYKKILNGEIDLKKIKLISITHVSNVLGSINPVKEIIKFFREIRVSAKILVDGAQSVPHLKIDVKSLGCDFLVFSSHKMLGPSGVGVLWAKKELLQEMDPFLVGSHMIKTVSKEKATWSDIPDKFETGTRNLEGVVGLGAAIDYLQSLGMENTEEHERGLTEYALKMFNSKSEVKLFGSSTPDNRLGVFSFNIGGVHPHDAAEVLNRLNIAVRSGHHCAQPLMDFINEPSTIRASVYIYNSREDLDKLSQGIDEVKKVFKV